MTVVPLSLWADAFTSNLPLVPKWLMPKMKAFPRGHGENIVSKRTRGDPTSNKAPRLMGDSFLSGPSHPDIHSRRRCVAAAACRSIEDCHGNPSDALLSLATNAGHDQEPCHSPYTTQHCTGVSFGRTKHGNPGGCACWYNMECLGENWRLVAVLFTVSHVFRTIFRPSFALFLRIQNPVWSAFA